jgi:hypothetical protein
MGFLKNLLQNTLAPEPKKVYRNAIPSTNRNAVMVRDWNGGDLMSFHAKPKGCNLCSPFFWCTFSLSGRDERYAQYETLPQLLRGDRCPACGTWIGWSNFHPELEEVQREVFGKNAQKK